MISWASRMEAPKLGYGVGMPVVPEVVVRRYRSFIRFSPNRWSISFSMSRPNSEITSLISVCPTAGIASAKSSKVLISSGMTPAVSKRFRLKGVFSYCHLSEALSLSS